MLCSEHKPKPPNLKLNYLLLNTILFLESDETNWWIENVLKNSGYQKHWDHQYYVNQMTELRVYGICHCTIQLKPTGYYHYLAC